MSDSSHRPGEPSPSKEADLTIGLVLACLGFVGTLLGFATAQITFYWRNYWRTDRLTLRILVTAIWSLEALHFISFSLTMFLLLVTWRLRAPSPILPKSSHVQVVCNTLATTIVQLFYLHRIWKLSQAVLLTTIIGCFVLGSLGITMTFLIKLILAQASPAPQLLLQKLSIIMNAMTASTDILITVALAANLMKSRIMGSRSARLINQLLVFTMNTGILTSVFQLLSLVTIITVGHTSFYIFFYYLGTRLYSMSMIASLNARHRLREHMADAPDLTTIPSLRDVVLPISGRDATSPTTPATDIITNHSTRTLGRFRFERHRDLATEAEVVPLSERGHGKAVALGDAEDELAATPGARLDRVHTLNLPTNRT